MYKVLLALGLVYFLSHVASATFRRTNVPDVLVLTLAGIVVGPLFGWVRPEQFGDVGGVLTTIALTVILFESGTTIDVRAVIRAAGGTATITLATMAASLVIAALITYAAGGVTLQEALLAGVILSGTSSAVVIPMVRSLKPARETGTLLILESALTDVLCIVLVFALLEAVQVGGIAPGLIIGQVLASMTFATVIGLAGGVAWLRIWNFVRRGETTVFTTIAAAFVLYGAAEWLGFSGPIAALAFGMMLSNHEFLRVDRYIEGIKDAGVTVLERGFYGEIVFLLKTFFFLYLGVSMRFNEPLVFLIAFGIIAGIYSARVLITRLVLPADASRRDASIVGVMVPKGLAAAVLAGLPVAAGLPGGPHIQNLAYAVVLLSITLTALLIVGLERGPLRSAVDQAYRRFPVSTAEPAP